MCLNHTVFFMLSKAIIIIHRWLTAQHQNNNPGNKQLLFKKNSKKSHFHKQEQNGGMLFLKLALWTYRSVREATFVQVYRTTNGVEIRERRRTIKTSIGLIPLVCSGINVYPFLLISLFNDLYFVTNMKKKKQFDPWKQERFIKKVRVKTERGLLPISPAEAGSINRAQIRSQRCLKRNQTPCLTQIN